MTEQKESLEGRVVVVTRDEGVEGPLTSELTRRGATVLSWPTVRIVPPDDLAPLDDAVTQIESYHWVALTSARAFDALTERWRVLRGGDLPEAVRIAAVGTGTARAVRAGGWPVHLEPEEHSSVALVRALRDVGVEGRRVLFPASSLAGRTLVQGLSELGAIVEEVVAYRTESVDLAPEAEERVRTAMEAPSDGRAPIDAVCFASPSAVQSWLRTFGTEGCSRLGDALVVAAIGATTAAAVKGAGILNPVVAEESTFVGLAEALEAAFARRP
ncbi:MAG: uroporphyrinogen-III synthase [Candidatus Eisenbacteria bacterium]|uniref:Uroporphyrinogen-III synthase n=1 Tax=Eiseniibacteriota bacterium TaxID=2212470 RepID=A0A956SCD7_UNCEI|nr:uroporphyrinogen-III synthase [Candidatus Eisenbacteria bacterium]MCB9462710.1 uroporphyrinogen-III synthase [Candidatus Eisenbacteria bacterium]